jgi:hypothetical protein
MDSVLQAAAGGISLAAAALLRVAVALDLGVTSGGISLVAPPLSGTRW